MIILSIFDCYKLRHKPEAVDLPHSSHVGSFCFCQSFTIFAAGFMMEKRMARECSCSLFKISPRL